jgi:hypothetical protein
MNRKSNVVQKLSVILFILIAVSVASCSPTRNARVQLSNPNVSHTYPKWGAKLEEGFVKFSPTKLVIRGGHKMECVSTTSNRDERTGKVQIDSGSSVYRSFVHDEGVGFEGDWIADQVNINFSGVVKADGNISSVLFSSPFHENDALLRSEQFKNTLRSSATRVFSFGNEVLFSKKEISRDLDLAPMIALLNHLAKDYGEKFVVSNKKQTTVVLGATQIEGRPVFVTRSLATVSFRSARSSVNVVVTDIAFIDETSGFVSGGQIITKVFANKLISTTEAMVKCDFAKMASSLLALKVPSKVLADNDSISFRGRVVNATSQTKLRVGGELHEFNNDGTFVVSMTVPTDREIITIEAYDASGQNEMATVGISRTEDEISGSDNDPQKLVKQDEVGEVKTSVSEAINRKREIAEIRSRLLSKVKENNKHSVAVIIGNKNYASDVPPVDFAHNDADAMKQFVVEHLGYRAGNIIDLRDATRNDIEAVFGNDKTHEGKLFNIIRNGKSAVTVYYSGHGVPGLNDKRPYLLPVNGNPNLAELTGYPINTLYKNLTKLDALSVTVFIDACFSGNSARGMLIKGVSGLSVEPKTPSSKEGITILTASQGDQLASWDQKAKQGLFTKHLLDALRGEADRVGFGNSDGKVSLAEVQKYLDEEMTYQARRDWNRRQSAFVAGPANGTMAVVFPEQ